jgi:hypothetical protein
MGVLFTETLTFPPRAVMESPMDRDDENGYKVSCIDPTQHIHSQLRDAICKPILTTMRSPPARLKKNTGRSRA